MEAGVGETARAMTRTPIQTAAMTVGVVFLFVGVAGFIRSIATNYDQKQFVGHESRALPFGIFQVSILHNIVHLGFGAWGRAAARSEDGPRTLLVAGGVIYAVLWIYGMVIDKDSGANVVPINRADDWLHFVLAVGMVGLGPGQGRRQPTAG